MDPLIRTAEERLAFLSGDEQMIRLYEAREEALIDRNSLLGDARNEGIEQGIEQGKADLIRSMLNKGLTATQIADLTGLTAEEVTLMR